MKNYLCTGTAVLALTAGLASADGHLAGEQVTVFGPWLGPDQETVEKVLAGFAEKTGADVRYVGSDSFSNWVFGSSSFSFFLSGHCHSSGSRFSSQSG
ncbi:conserved hypothetical protein [Rhodobacteraceae bacterium HTCC2083]|nr:conserved hypothetical protein [Rhodobacteraceae bacterium HTCC2083]